MPRHDMRRQSNGNGNDARLLRFKDIAAVERQGFALGNDCPGNQVYT